MFWYSLRVISGKEKSAEEQILRAAGDNEITNEIEEVFVPYEKVVEMRNNKKRIREKISSNNRGGMDFGGLLDLITRSVVPNMRRAKNNVLA